MSKKRAGKYGRLTIISFSHRNGTKGKRYFYNCICECGTHCVRRLDGGKEEKSCGCKAMEVRKYKRGYARNEIKTKEEAYMKNALNVYRVSYTDGDITFEKFLELSQQNCYLCDSPPTTKFHHGFYQDGTEKIHKRAHGEHQKISYCKFPDAWFVYNGLDRFDNTKKHTLDNVKTCCKTCNSMKSNKTYEQLVEQLKLINKKWNLV